jgi:hypothetical protein
MATVETTSGQSTRATDQNGAGMTLVMQVAIGVGFKVVPVIGGAGAVAGAAASGTEVAGSIGGVVAALVMIVGLFVTISWNNATRRREYEREINEAEHRGEERFRADMEFWRGIALGPLIDQGRPIPVPPSQQPDLPPRRPEGST